MPRFAKYSGAGNDFVIVRAEELGLDDASALARRICPRTTGVGVDGLILIRSLTDELVRVRFLNPDGSEFGTCGNGSRCAARYAADRGLVEKPDFVLVTDDGEIAAHVRDEEVSLDFSLDAAVEREIEAPIDGTPRRGWVVRMGTRHVVVPVESLELDDFDAVCRPIRSDASLGDGGANVDLVELSDAGVRLRTFERGVEGETQACGSGCMATALALSRAGLIDAPVSLETRGGARLTVEFLERERIRLSGPALHIFDGVYPDTSD